MLSHYFAVRAGISVGTARYSGGQIPLLRHGITVAATANTVQVLGATGYSNSDDFFSRNKSVILRSLVGPTRFCKKMNLALDTNIHVSSLHEGAFMLSLGIPHNIASRQMV